MSEAFRAFRVEESGEGDRTVYRGSVVQRDIADLPEGEVLIRVRYSSVNYKDALSARGNKGVTRSYPHTPGIDAAGEVVSATGGPCREGDEVIVIGYDLGMNTDGGFGQYIRVPAAWVVPRPEGLTLRESMILGTAGFTAALCLRKLLHNGLEPAQGKVLVSGATGGVGAVAVALLARLDFAVTALTGKQDAQAFLEGLGASEVIDRDALSASSERPMLREQWAGAVDVVGGDILSNIIKSLQYGGSVACCGLVASPAFTATVLPFILRGVNLLGVDSVNLPQAEKAMIWRKLAAEWKLDGLDALASEVSLDDLPQALESVYSGQARGRMLVNLG